MSNEFLDEDELDAIRKLEYGDTDDEDQETGSLSGSLHDLMTLYEKEIISKSLVRHDWNIAVVAAGLGIKKRALNGKIKKHGLERKP